MTKTKYNFYEEKLFTLEENFLKRKIPNLLQAQKYVVFEGQKCLNLSSNDYLGIASNEKIRDDFLNYFLKTKDKISNPSARLLSGEGEIYKKLEELLKKELKKESCLLFNSGYHANVGIFSSLVEKGDVVFCDRLNHASIIDGIRLSGSSVIPFKHLDYNDLENKLKKYRNKYKKAIISTESLFSMDGDVADIKILVQLKEKFNALLIVDEAHSFGVYGNGKGICAEQNILDNVDLIMGTFGKAVGSYGAFCVGEKILVDYLINFARSFIFSTVFPQISASFAYFVLKNYLFKTTEFQNKLFDLVNYVRKNLQEHEILGNSYILPVIYGENEKALSASQKFIQNGFYALALRYPTVAKNSARLRISLNGALEKEDLTPLFSLINVKK